MPDPARQFYSPYTSVGNNPIIGYDPDGRDCPKCPKDKAYDSYRNSNINYDYADRVGAFQMLPQLTVSDNKPLHTVPGWLMNRWDFVEGHMDFNIQANLGAVEAGDTGPIGYSVNLGAIELGKTGWKMDHKEGVTTQGTYGRYILQDGNIILSNGVRVEGAMDYKFKNEVTYNIFTQEISSYKSSMGIGAPFVEAKVVTEHSDKHKGTSIVFGAQEELAKSYKGFSLAAGFNISFQVNITKY